MYLIFNKTEHRVRAGIRMIVYLILSFSIVILINAFSFGGLEYLFTTLFSFCFFWVMYRFIDHRANINLAGITIEKTWLNEYGFGLLIAALVMGVIFITQLLLGSIKILGFSWNQPGTSDWMYPFLLFFFQMLCVSFYEELILRCYVLTNFKEGCTIGKIDTFKATIFAIIFSSSIFGLVHFFNPNITFFSLLNITLAGVMLAIPYLITGRLAYSVGIHFAWNFFQGGVFGFRVSGLPVHGSLIQIQQGGEAIWTGASFGPEGGLIGTIGIVLVMFLCLVFIKKSGVSLTLHSNFRKTYLELEGLTKEN